MATEPRRRTGIGADSIRYVHTLGPHGTNLESAAHEWLHRRGIDGKVELHPSLEAALDAVPDDGEHALAACAVYPALHTLTFGNLHRLHMVDSFLMPTHNMVLASAGADAPRTVSTHPAPVGLVSEEAEPRLVLSNSQAAIDCAAGRSEGCITTIVAAERYGLRVLRDYGPVPMVFTIHQVYAVDAVKAVDAAAGRPASTGARL
ncbi:bacilysin biosynthesis protein BacA [Streptomyces sp. NBC_01456]|uniref:bacilysin biosynthesis protein BacA n=1 Tax=unclassified Streptomyces TaxID=2593676 RepID=UPI002E33D1AB|nr:MULTISPECIES: bacilysin biosynthesis protein BacA [unclassified Streptomyces]